MYRSGIYQCHPVRLSLLISRNLWLCLDRHHTTLRPYILATSPLPNTRTWFMLCCRTNGGLSNNSQTRRPLKPGMFAEPLTTTMLCYHRLLHGGIALGEGADDHFRQALVDLAIGPDVGLGVRAECDSDGVVQGSRGVGYYTRKIP